MMVKNYQDIKGTVLTAHIKVCAVIIKLKVIYVFAETELTELVMVRRACGLGYVLSNCGFSQAYNNPLDK